MNFHQTSEPVLSRAFGLSIHQPISCHRSVPLLLRQLRKQASQAYLSVTSVVAKPPQLSALAPSCSEPCNSKRLTVDAYTCLV
jgi:hypothetical protein